MVKNLVLHAMQGFPVEYQLEQKRILWIAGEDGYKLFLLGSFFCADHLYLIGILQRGGVVTVLPVKWTIFSIDLMVLLSHV